MLARYFNCARLNLDSLSSFRGVEVEFRVPHFFLRFSRNILEVLPLGDPCPRHESALESSFSSLSSTSSCCFFSSLLVRLSVAAYA